MPTKEEIRIKRMKEAYEQLAEATEQEADVLYKTIQENFKSFKNTNKAIPIQVWLIHDVLYFNKKVAEIFEDGKEEVREMYIIVEPNEEVTEGACYHALYCSEETALEQIKEDEKEQS